MKRISLWMSSESIEAGSESYLSEFVMLYGLAIRSFLFSVVLGAFLTGCHQESSIETTGNLSSETNTVPLPPTSSGAAEHETHAGSSVDGELRRYFVSLLQEPNAQPEVKDDFEPLFVDWGQPDLVLFISGRQHGYIEPCGCAGLDQMKGGLLRRHAILLEMIAKKWPVVTMDLGDQVHRVGPQAQIKLESTYRALRSVMKYDAIGMGPGEFLLDPFPVYSALLNTAPDTDSPSPFISANGVIYDDREQILPYKVIEKNGRRVGVTSVVDLSFFEGRGDLDAADSDLRISNPETALKKILPDLLKEKCDVNVLLAYVPEETSRELAKKFPEFNFIVNEGVEGEPNGSLENIQVGQRNVSIMQMGYKSMFAGAIGIYAKPDQPVRYQKIPLDHRFQDTDAMKSVFRDYQMILKQKGLKQLIGDPVPHPSGYNYVGSESCKECHEDEYNVWKNGTDAWQAAHPGVAGPHSKATQDLVTPGERTWVERHHDPECLSCHVTGWNPSQYFAYQSGYWDFEKDQILHGSGCENCHGPASEHVAIENGDKEVDEATASKVLSLLTIDQDKAKKDICSTCHDLNNSPEFDFDKYWPMIEH